MQINGVNYSYDYEELIDCLNQDIASGEVKESSIIYLKRDYHREIEGYHPIIEYYIEPEEGCEPRTVLSTLEEMKAWNSII